MLLLLVYFHLFDIALFLIRAHATLQTLCSFVMPIKHTKTEFEIIKDIIQLYTRSGNQGYYR